MNRASPSGSPVLKPGDRIIGEVYKVLWDRLLLRLPGDLHGIVRQREMSWDEDEPKPETLAKTGASIEVVVVQVDRETRSAELSLRLADWDPWDDLESRYSSERPVEATVVRVRDFGAFVEIEPGVEGFIPVAEMRHDGGLTEAHEVLWPGDRVRALVLEVDPKKRQVGLSIKRFLDAAESGDLSSAPDKTGRILLGDYFDEATSRRLRQKVGDLPAEVEWPHPNLIRRVLVADDNPDYRQDLAALLRDLGYHVSTATSGEETLSLLDAEPQDLVVLDLSLSPESPLALATYINQLEPKPHILLLSGFEIDDATLQAAHAAGTPLEHKPLGSKALAKILWHLETGGHLGPETAAMDPHLDRQPLSTPAWVPGQEIQDFLRSLIAEVGAQGAVIFEQDEENPGEIIWRYQEGLRIRDTADVRSTLFYSPLSEVIRGRQMVTVGDSERIHKRTKYLRRAVEFRSCMGLPIEVPARQQPYALFLFSPEPNSFSKPAQQKATAAARHLATLLFRQIALDRIVSNQGEILRSQLRAGALHDIRHTLGSMDFKLERLDKLTARQKFGEVEKERTRSLALELQGTVDQMKRTAELVQELTRSERRESIDVNALVRRVVERHKFLASHYNILLTFKPDSALPDPLGNITHLQQVLDNLILNAIQWTMGRRRRSVSVNTETVADSNLAIQIRIQDTGPGIHRRLQDRRIFELGFSTRADGSGLGLFVVRSLLDSLGGQVSVEQSVMEHGTTFLVELPARSLPSEAPEQS